MEFVINILSSRLLVLVITKWSSQPLFLPNALVFCLWECYSILMLRVMISVIYFYVALFLIYLLVIFPGIITHFNYNKLMYMVVIRVWFMTVDLCLHHVGQNNTETHPSFFSVSTGITFPRSKVVGVWSWPLTDSYAKVKNVWSCSFAPPLIFLHGIVLKEALRQICLTCIYCFTEYQQMKRESFVLCLIWVHLYVSKWREKCHVLIGYRAKE
jgi:hypothetical protein